MDKVKSGQLDKLGLLYERYNKMLFGFFYHLNGSADVSQDLVQNVFERILKYRLGFKGDGQFKTWMFHIARNVNIDYHKKEKQNQKHGEGFYELDQLSQTKEELETEDKNLKLVQMALARLSGEKREIILLSKYQGKKYREIAKLFDCTEGNVKVKVFRALKDLKEVYQELEKKVKSGTF